MKSRVRPLVALALCAASLALPGSHAQATHLGAELVKNLNPTDFGGWGLNTHIVPFGNKVLFGANPTINEPLEANKKGTELYVSDGTEAGTHIVKDINPGSAGSNPDYIHDLGNGIAVFTATVSGAQRIFRTDGTEPNTSQLGNIAYLNSALGAVLNGWLYFNGSNPDVPADADAELWRTDGTTIELVKDIASDLEVQSTYRSSGPEQFATMGDRVYFSALTREYGEELWATNGTSDGTVLVANVRPGNDVGFETPGLSSNPNNLTAVGDTLYFNALVDPSTQQDLYKTQGTGATLVSKIHPTMSESTAPRSLAAVGNKLFFVAADTGVSGGGNGLELWVSGGTDATTFMVKNINPTGHGLNTDTKIVDLGGVAYFQATNGGGAGDGNELWRSDGAMGGAGTTMVKSILGGPEGGMPSSEIVVADGALFFVGTATSGDRNPWTSNGTEAGTEIVEDINPMSTGAVERLAAAGDTVFFQGFGDNTTSYELWKIALGSEPPDVPVISIADPLPIGEGNKGKKPLTFTVTLDAVATENIDINYQTANGSAKGSDYVSAGGVVIILEGAQSATFSILIKGDKKKEKTERFYVNLTLDPSETGATMGPDPQAMGTIKKGR